MKAIKVLITKFVDNSQPGWVECEFLDKKKKKHIFQDKVPIITTEYLDEESIYPKKGFLGCEILEELVFDEKKALKVTTEKPWDIETYEGFNEFYVFPNQIIDINI